MPRPAVLSAFTVDVEDYFQVEAFSARVSRADWDSRELRVGANTSRVLDLLDAHGVKATFFVLGWVARKAPEVVAGIAARGHEVACHSHWHRLVYSLSPEEFRSDLREATKAIEDAAQVRPVGYRAPSFSIVRRSLWALRILAEEGYAYDSSIFPIRHDIYGFPGFPRRPVRVAWGGGGAGASAGGEAGVSVLSDIPTPVSGPGCPAPAGASIVEFPPSTVRVLGQNLPGPGGGYLRIFPFWYLRWALRRITERERTPAMVYVHPWELDPGQPRIHARLRSRFRHYTGLERTAGRLAALFGEFRFGTMREAIAAAGEVPVVDLAGLDGEQVAGAASTGR